MAQRMVPSSFECDCGHQSHFGDSTVREMEEDSRRRQKRMLLLDSELEEHAIEFEEGQATTVICPKLGRRQITGWRPLQPAVKKRATPRRRVARRPTR